MNCIECGAETPNMSEQIKALVEALSPFAECCDQIDRKEDDEEWAKFRLLIKDYRRARDALSSIDLPVILAALEGWPLPAPPAEGEA